MKEIPIDGEQYVKKSDIPKQKIIAPEGDKSNPFMEVGKSYFIQTVTHYFTGTLIWVGEKEIVLKDCCWVADTGRFNEFIAGKTHAESEPFPAQQPVIIGRGSLIDMTERSLILEVK